MAKGTNLNDVAPTIYNKWFNSLFKKPFGRIGAEGRLKAP
jgi:hypothetical protein